MCAWPCFDLAVTEIGLAVREAGWSRVAWFSLPRLVPGPVLESPVTRRMAGTHLNLSAVMGRRLPGVGGAAIIEIMD